MKMKTVIDRRDFVEALQFVARMSPKRPTQPILAGVLMLASGNELKLTVYDYEFAAETTSAADVSVEGAVLVSSNMLTQLVAKLPNKPVAVEVVDRVLKVTCGSVKASIPLMPAEEYPRPDLAGDVVASLSGAVFGDAISRVSVAASNDDATPIIMGVHVVVGDSQMVLEATDRYRIARMVLECDTTDSANVIIPAFALREVEKAFSHAELIELSVTKSGAVTFSDGRGTILVRIISGNFPPVERLIPGEPVPHAVVERDVMMDATGRAALAIENQAAVRYVFGDGECSVTGSSDSQSNAVSEDFELKHDGDEVVLSLKPQFVHDALVACRSGEVSLHFTGGNQPGKPGPVLFFTGDSFRYLLQPNLLLK